MSEGYTEQSSPTIADLFREKVEASGLSQREIAKKIGFNSPNMISILKKGMAKVPLEKVPIIAKVLEIDKFRLLKLALEQSWPDKSDEMWDLLDHIASKNEVKLLRVMREAYNQADPELTELEIYKIVGFMQRLNPSHQQNATSSLS